LHEHKQVIEVRATGVSPSAPSSTLLSLSLLVFCPESQRDYTIIELIPKLFKITELGNNIAIEINSPSYYFFVRLSCKT
jgi:hypothetical protein